MKRRDFKYAIFDMDGLLIDSEPFWMAAEKDIFGSAGLILTDEMCLETRGLRIAEVVGYWHQRFPLNRSAASIAADLEHAVAERILAEGQAMAGVHQAIHLLKTAGYVLGLASSSPLPIINAVTSRLGINDDLKVALSAGDLLHGKPHPMVYMQCSAQLGASTWECIAFEDSITGLISAKAASIFSIGVPDPLYAHDPRFSIADLVLPSMSAFSLELLNER